MPRFLPIAALAVITSISSLPVAAQTPAQVIFEAPAAKRPAGATSLGEPFDRVLPSGRIVHPAGLSVVTGMNAMGVALSPDGRFAVVTNDDERQAKTVSTFDATAQGGYSLAVVDTASMRVVDRYREPSETFFAGIIAVVDPANPANTLVLASGGASNVVYAFDLDAGGRITPDAHHIIPIPGSTETGTLNAGRSFPGNLVASPTGTHAYVVNNLGNSAVELDLLYRSVVGAPVATGYFPFGVAYASNGLLVANEGVMQYGRIAPSLAPPFLAPIPDVSRSSSVSVLGTDASEALGPLQFSVALDRGPDGLREIGGAHPSALAAMRSRPYAFVALAGVDRIATLQLSGAEPRAAGGTELRLYDRGPYGTQPVALALSPDERKLFVALAGINAIAELDVTDPTHPHRVGLIPTGWYPDALALSRDGRYLYVANAKGYAHDRNFTGDQAGYIDVKGRVDTVQADSGAVWSTLERIDLDHTSLRKTTPLALACLRAIRPARSDDKLVPQSFGSFGSTAIKHVVLILEESKTFDAMLGDLRDTLGRQLPAGDPTFVAFDETVTPNLHALARGFGVATNFYADAEDSDGGHQVASAGITSDFTERTRLVRNARRPLTNRNQDVEDYPRSGYIFNSLALRGKTYRDYGDLVRVAGYDEGEAPEPKADDPHFAGIEDQSAPTEGLGGLYALDAPALGALAGHVDLNYPGWNLRIRDTRRAAEFVRDIDPFVKADQLPAYLSIWLPADRGGSGPNVPPLPESVADGDRALGQIVEYLSHTPQWQSTAIFITPASAEASRDHVDVNRAYAIVVSPWAKRGFTGTRHLSTVSVLKTEEEILGLPALSLGDALATDMSDFFSLTPNYTPFLHLDVPPQAADAERGQGNLRAR